MKKLPAISRRQRCFCYRNQWLNIILDPTEQCP